MGIAFSLTNGEIGSRGPCIICTECHSYIVYRNQVVRYKCAGSTPADNVGHLAWEATLQSARIGGGDGDYERSEIEHITFGGTSLI